MSGNNYNPGLIRRIINRIEAKHVIIGLLLSSAGLGLGLWQALRPSDLINEHLNLITELSQKYAQSQEVVRSFLSRLEKDKVPPEKWPATLDQILVEYKKFRDQASAFQTDDPKTKLLLEQGLQLAEQTKYKEAFNKLRLARERELEMARKLETALQQRKIKAAEVTAMEASLRNIDRQFLTAAGLFEHADKLVRGFDNRKADDYLHQAIKSYYFQGESQGNNQFLEKSVNICMELLNRTHRQNDRERWGQLQITLGKSLSVLGEREGDAKRLKNAIQAYGAALEVFPYWEAPSEYAIVQNARGDALRELYWHEKGTKSLEQSVKSFKEALRDCYGNKVSLTCASSYNNLGIALKLLSSHKSDTNHLELAVKAYEKALKGYTKDRTPVNWATVQNNLGNALCTLGKDKSDLKLVQQALASYERALEKYADVKAPLDWAMVKNNQGWALIILSGMTSGKKHLECFELAVQAYEDSLDIYIRRDMPLDCAMVQNNLASALYAWGTEEPGTQKLELAEKACRHALVVYTPKYHPVDRVETQINLADILQELGKRKSDSVLMREAITTQEAALKAAKEIGHDRYIETCNANLIKCHQALKELQTRDE